MIQITPQMKIFISIEAIDFRKGIDGIAQICREKFNEDPFSGKVFIFSNKTRKAIKILVYDTQGFWVCMKRLSKGKFKYWPQIGQKPLTAQDVGVLLWNGNPLSSAMQLPWRQIE